VRETGDDLRKEIRRLDDFVQRVEAARRRYRNALAALTEGAENHTFSSGKGQE
jgi:hypothetical protein